MPKIIKNGISYGVPANLSDLYDTVISNTPSNNDVLRYNSSTGKWENAQVVASDAYRLVDEDTSIKLRYINSNDATTWTADTLGATDSISVIRASITGAWTTGHLSIYNCATVGTPFQLGIHDSSELYFYKRWSSSGTWGTWTKMNAGVSDSCSGNAATATMPLGFSSRSTGVTWGNTTGTSFTAWNDSTGGSIDFRRDNPSSGKMSVKVDGRFYFNEGTTPTAGLKSANSYWGMTGPDGEDNVWIRTTTAGIIPYQSGGSSAGHCGLGTSSWYFSTAYIQNIYGYLNGSCSGSAGSALTATKSVYCSLTKAGSTTSNTAKALTVPSDASEIIVTAQFTSKLFSSSFPKERLTSSNQEVWVGGGRGGGTSAVNSDSARALCYLKISGTTLTIQGLTCNDQGTDRLSSTTWTVFYR